MVNDNQTVGKKRLVIAAAIALTIALNGCKASGITDTGKVGIVEDYHITDGWSEGEYVTSAEGHRWWVENPGDYTGYVSIAFDSKGTEDLNDDELLIVIEGG